MDGGGMTTLREALEGDESLRARFMAAKTEEDVLALARDAGIEVDVVPEGQELSDRELESVSGGYTFPATDWVYCDNPWTNAWCTLKC